MDNKIIAVIAVAVVAVVAVGAYFALSGDDDDSSGYSPDGYPDSYLIVLGNADNSDGDNAFTSADADAIQSFIDNSVAESDSYSYSDYYMYDANYDGTIDSADVDKVNAIISALESDDWSGVGTVYYVNVDYEIASYDMTHNNKVITLIAPPLDTVLALGGNDLVVGTDNRIIDGKYSPEYSTALDIDNLYNVGSCNEPDTEIIMQASDANGGVNVVCGTADSYGPTMEETFSGTDVQVIRIGSWEYGSTLYGLMTLGFLLKLTDESQAYYEWYMGIHNEVLSIVDSVSDDEKVGAAACYGYLDELSLLGEYSGEYTNLMVLEPYDSTEAFLSGSTTGGHGNTISTEDINTMVDDEYGLQHLILMVGAPFQIETYGTGSDNYQASQAYFIEIYDKWLEQIAGSDEDAQAEFLSKCDICVTGFSFSSGVSEVLNQLILCYYLYPDEFRAYYEYTDYADAEAKIGGYVNEYCAKIGINELWEFTSSSDGVYGMNLLYCGENDDRNILNGI
jgi:hypothetical protein